MLSHYRPNVAGIVRRSNGDILIGERLHPAGSWQFPQGGIQKGETPEQALYRELKEEIGLPPSFYTIHKVCGPFCYRFPNQHQKDGFDGQEQHYFLVHLQNEKEAYGMITHRTLQPEFRNLRWIVPDQFQTEWVLEAKRPVYRSVFQIFFQIDLPEDKGSSLEK